MVYLRQATEKHAKDSKGEVVEGTMLNDLSLDVQWTDATWEDGVPVTKCFSRNPEMAIEIPEGTHLVVATYAGFHSGITVADFMLNGVWYSARWMEAISLLNELGLNVEPSDADQMYSPDHASGGPFSSRRF